MSRASSVRMVGSGRAVGDAAGSQQREPVRQEASNRTYVEPKLMMSPSLSAVSP